MAHEDIEISIHRRGREYYVVATFGGHPPQEVGPMPSEVEARLYYNHLLNICRRNGAQIIDHQEARA